MPRPNEVSTTTRVGLLRCQLWISDCQLAFDARADRHLAIGNRQCRMTTRYREVVLTSWTARCTTFPRLKKVQEVEFQVRIIFLFKTSVLLYK